VVAELVAVRMGLVSREQQQWCHVSAAHGPHMNVLCLPWLGAGCVLSEPEWCFAHPRHSLHPSSGRHGTGPVFLIVVPGAAATTALLCRINLLVLPRILVVHNSSSLLYGTGYTPAVPLHRIQSDGSRGTLKGDCNTVVSCGRAAHGPQTPVLWLP
jgi:hypothetical protein